MGSATLLLKEILLLLIVWCKQNTCTTHVNGEIEGRVTDKQDKFIPTRISTCLRSHHAVISSYQEQSDARPVRVSVGALATIATLCKIKEKSRNPLPFFNSDQECSEELNPFPEELNPFP